MTRRIYEISLPNKDFPISVEGDKATCNSAGWDKTVIVERDGEVIAEFFQVQGWHIRDIPAEDGLKTAEDAGAMVSEPARGSVYEIPYRR